jgi:hypothetical protein
VASQEASAADGGVAFRLTDALKPVVTVLWACPWDTASVMDIKIKDNFEVWRSIQYLQ